MLNTNIKENFDIEELDDFDTNDEVSYLVCALGYDEDDEITDCEVYLGEFKFPDEAVAFAKTVTLGTILQRGVDQVQAIAKTAYFNLEVETVVEYDDPDNGTENIDTIWERQIWLA